MENGITLLTKIYDGIMKKEEIMGHTRNSIIISALYFKVIIKHLAQI